MSPRFFLLFITVWVYSLGEVRAETVERMWAVMGTTLHASLEAPTRDRGLRALEAAFAALLAADQRLSTWRTDSELARLNATTTPTSVSPKLAAELSDADRCRLLTEGTFDPGVGRFVQLWGLRSGGRIPSEAELADALPWASLTRLERVGPQTFRRPPGLLLEEGAFGKGAALDDALATLMQAGITRATLNLGGQIASLAPLTPEFALAHPQHRTTTIATLVLQPGSFATSGVGEKHFDVAGHRFGHILDPRTGRPASDWGSVTVWAPSAFEADCLSTGLYVLGFEKAVQWAFTHPTYEVVIVRARPNQGLRLHATPNIARGMRVTDPRANLVIFRNPQPHHSR